MPQRDPTPADWTHRVAERIAGPGDLERFELRRNSVAPVRINRAAGTPSPYDVRTRAWRRTGRGFYVPSSVDGDVVEQRIREAAALAPAQGALTGWAALRWLGARWFDGLDAAGNQLPVTIVVGTHDIRTQPGIWVSAEGLNCDHIITSQGLTLTLPSYAVSYEMRYAGSLGNAVGIFDRAAFSDLVTINEQADFLAKQNGWTGIPLARKAIPHVDENSWSPQETSSRRIWQAHVLGARLLSNAPVFDLRGRHVGTPDLIDPEAGVIGEYDGSHHLQGEQRALDLRRQDQWRALGLESVTRVAEAFEPQWRFLERLSAAYQRAGGVDPARRSWTVDPPPGWVSTRTVAARRALSREERQRFLRYRAS